MADKLMKSNPASRQAEGKNSGTTTDITKPVTKSLNVPTTPEAVSVQGFDTVQQFDRSLPKDAPERARQRNSASRDARTNLGRTGWATPTVEGK
jgi:hypothetical protein